MTPKERKSLAEQLTTNPLFSAIFDKLESDAIEDMIAAQTDLDRLTLSLRVKEVRNFRFYCKAALNAHDPDQ